MQNEFQLAKKVFGLVNFIDKSVLESYHCMWIVHFMVPER